MTPTVPGDIPGLLQRGATGWCFDLARKPVQCVVVSVGATAALVSFRQVWDGYFPGGQWVVENYTVDVALADISIDLSDATSRAHAAWWLVATLWPEQLNRHEWVWSRWSGTDGHWQLGPPGAIPQRWSGYKSSVYRYHGFVPTLSDLNYRDPRILPDGSRWVDAEALRRVVLHVAGRPL